MRRTLVYTGWPAICTLKHPIALAVISFVLIGYVRGVTRESGEGDPDTGDISYIVPRLVELVGDELARAERVEVAGLAGSTPC